MSDFTELLEAEIPKLRRYARALTRDPARADDLVQNSLVRAIAKQHLWQPGTDLRAWLFTILHHQNIGVPLEHIALTAVCNPLPRCKSVTWIGRSPPWRSARIGVEC